MRQHFNGTIPGFGVLGGIDRVDIAFSAGTTLGTAFITDSGARGSILVVDLEKGTARSRLDGHPSTQPGKGVEVTADGRKLQRPDGRVALKTCG